ncbi:protein PIN-LIKES 3-like [Cicer arietinum]|uniref:Protein PIN-LIKES 3-like n=1 Tax=Cicer arietinum TaxID=3827 RepID=A0A1S2Z5E1_CICAR|nr:protein PIN-LIKES 3-like [Cicer arietinum]
MEFMKLFLVALAPLLNIFIIAALGAILALQSIGILRKNAKKHLNIIVYFVFTPALLYSLLANSITLGSLVMLWFLPLNILLRYIIGSTLAWFLNKTIRVPRHLHGLVMGCCAAGNIGTLPLIIVPTICIEGSHLFGNVDVCTRNALAFTSLTSAVGHICCWSIVYNFLRIYSLKPSVVKFDESTKNNEIGILENISKCSKKALSSIEEKSLPSDCIDHLEIECKVVDGQEKVQEKSNIMKHLKNFTDRNNLKALFAPALWGVVVGVIIGIVPQLRKVLIGESAPLHMLHTSVAMLGDACIPTMILIVGANLLKGLKGIGKMVPLVVGIILVMYVALPSIGIGIVKGAIHFNLISSDPLYHFVLLLHYAVPPAVSVSTMTQLFGVGKSECSVIMFATYASAPILLTLWCTVFMWLVL